MSKEILSTTSLTKAARKMKSLAPELGNLGLDIRNKALNDIAQILREDNQRLARINQQDLEQAELEELAEPLLARLKFQGGKIASAADGVEAVARLPDPIGKILTARELDDGLMLKQVTCPLGVVAMIFESRPDALVQIASLALKSGNAVILKGGSEAKNSNRALAELIHDTAVKAGVPAGWLFLAETRDEVKTLLGLGEFVDLIIPRGSNAFVQYIMSNTSIPVLGHADGICHVYLDSDVDINKAIPIVVDSKTQYVSVCNAAETLLVHSDCAPFVLPPLKLALEAKKVELRGCSKTRKILPGIHEAVEQDWETEYLDYILSIKIVDTLKEAVEHINMYGSRHTDAIVTENRKNAELFMNLVDSANVFWNCSTRFADGFRYGLGAEVGVGTGKIHARGPVGVEGLMIYKWKLYGSGQIVASYSGDNAKPFKHKDIDVRGLK